MVENNIPYFYFSERNIHNAILFGSEDGWKNQPECAYTYTIPDNQVTNVPCAPETPVRYLTIRHYRETKLGICEVIVNGYRYQSEYTIFNDMIMLRTNIRREGLI